MITLDSSGVIALARPRDRNHQKAVGALEAARSSIVVPAPVLSEIAWVLELRMGPTSMDGVLSGLERGTTLLDCCDSDIPRVRELMARYADLGLGFSDAAVIACAERNGGTVLTFDRRDFDVVAGEGLITIIP